MLEQAGKRWLPIALGFVALAAVVFLASVDYWGLAYRTTDDSVVLQGAEIVRATTEEDEYVDLGCIDWDPSIMFYAERKGFAAQGDGTFTTFDDPRVCIPGNWEPRAVAD